MKNLLKIMLSALVALFMVAPALAYPDVAPDHWAAKQIEILTNKFALKDFCRKSCSYL